MQLHNGTIITTLVHIQVNRLANDRFRAIESSYTPQKKTFLGFPQQQRK